jgi:hypothetical protein
MGRQLEFGPVLGGRRVGLGLAGLLAAGAAFAGPVGSTAAAVALQCSVADSEGIAESDARTAGGLVCDRLQRASAGQGVYEVRFATLGKAVFVTVARREPPDSVTVRIDAIEEMETAAERIAQALVRGEPFTSTQRVGNLLESETRGALTKKGSIKFLVGVADVESPGHGARAAGFSIGILYAAPTFALPAETRFAWDDTNTPDPELTLLSISLGGRAYFSRKDVSPFMGAGIGALKLDAREGGGYPSDGVSRPDSQFFYAELFGVAPYLEAGVEALRLHRARLALHLRADFPTATLESPAVPIYSYETDWQREPVVQSVYPAQSRYIVPVSIGLSVAF